MKIIITDKSLKAEVLDRATISAFDLQELLNEKFKMYDRWQSQEWEKYKACEDEGKQGFYNDYKYFIGLRDSIGTLKHELKNATAEAIFKTENVS